MYKASNNHNKKYIAIFFIKNYLIAFRVCSFNKINLKLNTLFDNLKILKDLFFFVIFPTPRTVLANPCLCRKPPQTRETQ